MLTDHAQHHRDLQKYLGDLSQVIGINWTSNLGKTTAVQWREDAGRHFATWTGLSASSNGVNNAVEQLIQTNLRYQASHGYWRKC